MFLKRAFQMDLQKRQLKVSGMAILTENSGACAVWMRGSVSSQLTLQ